MGKIAIFPFRIVKNAVQYCSHKLVEFIHTIPSSGFFDSNSYEKKINLSRELSANFGKHRSGWIYAVRNLKYLHKNNGIIFDSFIERTFCWHPERIRPHLQPWIGVIHVPPNIPRWFLYHQSNEMIFSSEAWKRSIPFCMGLFTLSMYHRKSLEKKLDVPVNNLIFPTEIPVLKWSWDKFEANKEKKIVQIGWWLRKLHSIFQLPKTDFKKVFLNVEHKRIPDLMKTEREILRKESSFKDSMYDTAETVKYLPNDEYDRLLCENIVFLYMYDASANNTVIECIARNTPILVNPIEPVKEYLGEDYPFYYEVLI